MSTRMNVRHKKFILNRLIPFILREQGRGFGMSSWKITWIAPGVLAHVDGINRKVPSCGTVACIGGSIEVLTAVEGDEAVGAKIGLDAYQADGLFYGWQPSSHKNRRYGWPKKYARMYDRAKSVYGKARVAAALLREVVRTGGKCLVSPE